MYCPSCGNEATVELKYCNRCGANLTQGLQSMPTFVPAPVKLTVPTLVVGLTVVAGLGIIFAGVTQLAFMHFHPFALLWIVLFSMATLFGCTGLLLRFWSEMLSLQRKSPQFEVKQPQPFLPPQQHNFAPSPQLPPRLDHIPSVTEHTTRTFSPAYKDQAEPK